MVHDEEKEKPKIVEETGINEEKISIEQEKVSDGEIEEQKLLQIQCRAVSSRSFLNGDKRLVIKFDNFGRLGRKPQRFGKNNRTIFIPNGLCGSHRMYGEPWRFEIFFEESELQIEDNKDDDPTSCICIAWRITNLNSNRRHTYKESKHEAIIRTKRGRTVSSKLFRSALEHRAKDLEKELELWTKHQQEFLKTTVEPSSLQEQNQRDNIEIRLMNLRSKIRSLRPVRFSEGTLVFGLQHPIVQEKILQI